MTTMRTTNGLTVPVGYGGDGRVVLKGAQRPPGGTTRAHPRGKTFPAGQLTEGTYLRGSKTLDTYELLHRSEPENGKVTLTVMNTRTTEIRHWTRRTDFRVELA